jgi:hypothetical protein
MSATSDRFARAVAAFRERTLGDGDGGASRVAIVQGLARQSRRRRGARLLAAVLGLALAVPVAHAGWEKCKALLAQRSQPAGDFAPGARRTKAPGKARKIAPIITPVTEPAVDAAASPAEEPPQEPAKPAPKPNSSSDELALYGRAHDLHFHGNDTGKALSAWSLYLTKFPQGQLAPEARYNRAICLFRLGRVEDAKVALSELAASAPAAHQRTQAKRLLQRLESR